MNLHCIKCSRFTNNNNNIKIKQKTDRKSNLFSRCFDCGFKTFEIIDKEDLSDLLKSLDVNVLFEV